MSGPYAVNPILTPGFRAERLTRLMHSAIRQCDLDLTGLVVFTEAASGAYAVTPVIAALAGAQRVFALARSSAHGNIGEVTQATTHLAESAGVTGRIEIVTRRQAEIVAQADIVTNTGHVRPIDSEMVAWMKPTAVVPLMYESWEFRLGDVDLDACTHRGIAVAGTNETNPAVATFSYLAMMAIRLLLDAGVVVWGSRILLLSDNPFRPFLEQGLTQSGALVQTLERFECPPERAEYDVILVAMRPREHPVIGAREVDLIARHYPGAIVAQFWGDLDRQALSSCNVPFYPTEAPPPGHQGILPSSIGPEAVVRLQTGGLKVGEVMARARLSNHPQKNNAPRQNSVDAAVSAAVASGFGQARIPDGSGTHASASETHE